MPYVVRQFIAQINGEHGSDVACSLGADTEDIEEMLKELSANQVNKFIDTLGINDSEATIIKRYRRRLKNRVYTRVARSKARRGQDEPAVVLN